MIVLYILIFIIAVIFLLLFSSISLKFSFDERIYLKLTFLGFKIFELDSSEKDKPSNKKKTSKKEQKDKEKLADSVKKYAKSKNVFTLIFEIFTILLAVLKKLKSTIGHLRFYNVNFDLTVSSPDAAETAILYGKMCSVISPVVAILSGNFRFQPECISLRTDFLSEKTKIKASGIIKLRLIHVISFALTSVFAILKMKIGEIKYVRK